MRGLSERFGWGIGIPMMFLVLGWTWSTAASFRIRHARIEGGALVWDVEARGEGGETLGNGDFYLWVNPAGFTESPPLLSKIDPSLGEEHGYGLRTGRARQGQIAWIALDGSGASPPYRLSEGWTRLFSVSLRVVDARQTSGLRWHEMATAAVDGAGFPLEAALFGAFDAVLEPATIAFRDVTAEWVEVTGPGSHAVAWADVNGDGYPDFYLPFFTVFGQANRDRLYINQAGKRFVEEAEARGVADLDGGSHGACFADLDNDGDYDLVNGTTARIGGPADHNDVLINRGEGLFEDITASLPDILNTAQPTRAVCAFDMEADGDLDLFMVSGYLGSDDPPEERNEIYRNEGGLRFTALTGHGLETVPGGQGVTDTDFDGDGDIDLFIANRTGPLNILKNRGDGTFDRVVPEEIGISHRAGDGITMGDIDQDGDLDMILVTGDERVGHLYRNRGGGFFEYVRSFQNVMGYMAGFVDLDNDGDLDLVFPCPEGLFLNDGSGNFVAGPLLPLDGVKDPRSIAFADMDGNGLMDIAVGDKKGSFRLLQNATFFPHDWLKIRLSAPNGQAGAFGAKVYVYPSGDIGGRLLAFRESRSTNGYLGQDDPVLHVGLGVEDRVDLLVRFLTGEIAIRKGVESNQTVWIQGADRRITIRCFLEGAHDASRGRMRTDLNEQGLVPYRSPYPEDRRTIADFPVGTVDWILIRFREASRNMVFYQSALLCADGTVTDGLTGSSSIHLSIPEGAYFIGLFHRNHLPIETATPVLLDSRSTDWIDFSDPRLPTSSGSHRIRIDQDRMGLIAGNAANHDREILADDLAAIRLRMGQTGYDAADVTCDGRIDASDEALAARRMLNGSHSLVVCP